MLYAARERRRSMRLRPQHAKAVCSTRNAGGVYSIEDLSHGGLLLEGHPSVPPGTRVALRLMVPGTHPMDIAGRVIRSNLAARRRARLAIRFSSVTADIEDRVADLIAQEWSKVCGPTCIVAATCPHLRLELSRRIEAQGARVSRARTPIELILKLETRPSATIVFLGATLGRCSSTDIATFLGHSYPRIHRILVTLSNQPEGAVTPDALEAIVQPPWSGECLRKVLEDHRQPRG